MPVALAVEVRDVETRCGLEAAMALDGRQRVLTLQADQLGRPRELK